jgi:eukaryotic-like serine/threonine-protein kinase
MTRGAAHGDRDDGVGAGDGAARQAAETRPDDSVASLAEPMAQARPTGSPGAPLARARMFGALFGAQSASSSFARFRVIERLGAGGMGVVYEAYDPDLARGVALKLVEVASKDREAALAEAKALARLSHPNVVPIYDVGLERDHVYLVMELVRGETLRQWQDGRPWRQILEIYQQAGTALVAAHAAGLVHRDFKPDNAIVGNDGRVRVVDFGLACEADDGAQPTTRRAIGGTPRYMAPEMKAGAAVTPAVDQYSFAVALEEALAHAGPPPARLASILARGHAAEPSQRFDSMSALLRALAKDPARAWRRAAAVAALATVLGSLTFALGRRSPSAGPSCDDGGARLEAAWSSAERQVALARLTTLGAYGASLRPLLERDLASYARRWQREDRAACVARRRGSEPPTLSERRTLCLERGRDAVVAVRELITRVAHAAQTSATDLPGLTRAVQSMPDPTACGELVALLSDVPPPPPEVAADVAAVRSQVVRAGIEIGAGAYERAWNDASTAVAQARAISYPALLAETLLVQGHARMLSDRTSSIPILREATAVALAAHHDAIAVEAWARRAWAEGTSNAPFSATAGLELLEALAQRTDAAKFARALLYNNLGSVELARDHRAAARAYFQRALKEAQTIAGASRDHPGCTSLVSAQEVDRIPLELLYAIGHNLGLTDDRGCGDQILQQTAAQLSQRLGATHPDTLGMQWTRGDATVEDLRQAVEVLTPVCQGYALHHQPDSVARCWTEVALLQDELGAPALTIEAMQQAVQALDHPLLNEEAPEAAPYLHFFQGDAALAIKQFVAALTAIQAKQGPEDRWWDGLTRGQLRLGLGRAYRRSGELRAARRELERAIADLEVVVRDHPAARYERRLGRARTELAYTLEALRVDAPARRAAAGEAIAWLRRVGGSADDLEHLARLTADTPRR